MISDWVHLWFEQQGFKFDRIAPEIEYIVSLLQLTMVESILCALFEPYGGLFYPVINRSYFILLSGVCVN